MNINPYPLCVTTKRLNKYNLSHNFVQVKRCTVQKDTTFLQKSDINGPLTTVLPNDITLYKLEVNRSRCHLSESVTLISKSYEPKELEAKDTSNWIGHT